VESSEDVPSLVDLCTAVESASKPVVAAIRGFALGGGMELALACDYRIADFTASFGLPEVNIGLIPGAGGTQRLPRLTSLEFALEMVTTGRNVKAKQGMEVGLVDAMPNANETLEECAVRWAKWAALFPNSDHRRTVKHGVVTSTTNPKADTAFLLRICDEAAGQIPSARKGGEAKQAAVNAIRAACRADAFIEGCAVEEQLFWDLLLDSDQGRALRHAFFAERAAQQRPISRMLPVLSGKAIVGKECVGVIGAGTMGSGIATSFLRAGYPKVILLDVKEEGLARGVAMIKATIQGDVKKGRMKAVVAGDVLKNRLIATQSYDDLKSCDVIVEAVFESLKLKKSVFKTLDQVVKNKKALLLTNTSTLDINAIAESLSVDRRQYCLGMHFFSPAHLMKLVEIVCGDCTSDETVSLVRAHTKKIKKVGVVVNNCDGFVGNRMIRTYTTEMLLLLEGGGCSVVSIDQAIRNFGMALGPFQMSDLAGNDIGYLIKQERKQKGTLYERESDLGDELVVKHKRAGMKVLKGWYNYDKRLANGRVPLPSTEVDDYVKSYRASRGLLSASEKEVSANAVVERLIYPLINEGFKILEENIAYNPSDIDIIYLYGYGFPAWRGGPMHFADHGVGLPKLLKKLQEFNAKYPGSDYYTPSRLLKECVGMGIGVQEYYDKKMRQKAKSKL